MRSGASAAILAIVVGTGLPARAGCQAPYLVADLASAPAVEPSSLPREFTALGSQAYFVAGDAFGRELFRTDGTAAGTGRLADLRPGSFGSFDFGPAGFTSIAGRLVFVADDGVHGRELFATDGTPAGTGMIADLRPGSTGAEPMGLTAFNGAVYCSADDGALGVEPWCTNGTSVRLLLDVEPGPGSSSPSGFVPAGSSLFYTASTAAAGRELWVTDGTAANTRLVADLTPGPTDTRFGMLAPLGSMVCFSIENAVSPSLWVSDGTAAGTAPIATVAGGQPLALLGTVLVFRSRNELWRTDGSAAGSFRLRDDVWFPLPTGELGGLLLFGAFGPQGQGLWRPDGTLAGTVQVHAVGPSTTSRGARRGSELLFAGSLGPARGVWRTDGTAAGTALVRAIDIPSGGYGIEAFAALGNSVLFSADDGSGAEPWVSDGTAAGTARLANLASLPAGATRGSHPSNLVEFRGALWFTADDGVVGSELWRSDGTAAGTTRIADLLSGPGSAFARLGFVDGQLVPAGDRLFAFAHDGLHPSGNELWVSDGTAAGTTRLAAGLPFTGAVSLAAFGNRLLLALDRLWICDGTPAGTRELAPIHPSGLPLPADLVVVGARAFFTADDGVHGRELCITDGTAAGTRLVRDIAPDRVATSPRWLTAAGDRVFFAADDGEIGEELWVSDGTAAGTRPVLDLRPGPLGSRPTGLAAHGRAVVFAADDGASGRELWFSDGTADGTMLLGDVAPGGRSSDPLGLVIAADGTILTTADDGMHGREPIAFVPGFGAPATLDLEPGPLGSDPELWSQAGRAFVTTDASRGPELWRTDGTMPGTRRLAAFTSRPDRPRVAAGLSFFRGDDPATGAELWAFAPGALVDIVGRGCGQGLRAPSLRASAPWVGATLSFTGGLARVGAPAALAIGKVASPPVVLGGECIAYVDFASTSVLATFAIAGESWRVDVPVPDLPALRGVTLAAQIWLRAPGAPTGVELSNGLHLTF